MNMDMDPDVYTHYNHIEILYPYVIQRIVTIELSAGLYGKYEQIQQNWKERIENPISAQLMKGFEDTTLSQKK
jgi:hypothetical protein